MKKVFEYEIELDFVQWNIDPKKPDNPIFGK